ncbi:copper-binding metallochaperone CopP [Helicobacter acinonychis]|uniref:Copper iron binding protein n=1 Tax=Helicobacter acinonychis (strain Sheeba) TaxID=382638 RepID=Q17WN4_HELAH|nr:copper-binding metallochaperone CopP [Helicobacter acinonychis]CAJ99942.1 copper iron binding protein [Helicobacter acinonychis str. Sheeba]STP04491.1 COP-associated protein [Helicobacter acinonychis]
MKVTFQVPSITCGHCVDKIEKFVGEIEGVNFIDVSVENKSVIVEFDAPATQDLIKEALLDAGQEVV